MLVEELVKVSKRRLSGVQTDIVEKSNETGKGGRRTRGTIDGGGESVDDNIEVVSLGGNIRESSSGLVVILRGREVLSDLEVLRDERRLVRRTSPVVGETTTGKRSSDFGVGSSGTTDSGDVRRGSGVSGDELLAERGLTSTNTTITGRGHDRKTTDSHLLELSVHTHGIVEVDSVLVVTVRDGEDKRGIGGVTDVVQPDEEGLAVGVAVEKGGEKNVRVSWLERETSEARRGEARRK